jgi:hypothetical protein
VFRDHLGNLGQTATYLAQGDRRLHTIRRLSRLMPGVNDNPFPAPPRMLGHDPAVGHDMHDTGTSPH